MSGRKPIYVDKNGNLDMEAVRLANIKRAKDYYKNNKDKRNQYQKEYYRKTHPLPHLCETPTDQPIVETKFKDETQLINIEIIGYSEFNIDPLQIESLMMSGQVINPNNLN